ncbi:MAG: hypothetical protein EA378_06360 [Phycisphaerales bacterium]|nr:MAG: hypothetical protein EA378_06360 [Phycisphaerales bacterium]
MSQSWVGGGVRGLRWASVGVAAGGSILAAGGLLWVLVRPEVLGEVQTGALVTVVALLALPVVSLAALAADRRICREQRLAARIEKELREQAFREQAFHEQASFESDLHDLDLHERALAHPRCAQRALTERVGALAEHAAGRAAPVATLVGEAPAPSEAREGGLAGVSHEPKPRDRLHRRRRRPDALTR